MTLDEALTELQLNLDDCEVIGGSSVYEIDGAGTKWAPVSAHKYNERFHYCKPIPVEYLMAELIT